MDLVSALRKIVASQRSDIINLQPDTVLTVYHGTDHDYAYDMALNGIDARQPHSRKYPHHSGGKELTRGIYVTHELKVAREFGMVVLKFKVIGKNLWPMFPTLMKKDDKALKDKYPNSYRPSVSHDMLERRQENQALFIGAVSPRAIEKIFVHEYGSKDHRPMSREDFIKERKEKSKKHKREFVVEPQEADISLEDFIARIAENENSTVEDIQKTIDFYMGRAKTRDDKRRAFYEIFEAFAPYSVLKKLVRKAVK